MKTDDEIDRLREKIDDLDIRIRGLLNERADYALAIGTLKRQTGSRVYDPAREATIIRRVLEENSGPLKDDALRRLFERILDESRRLERTAVEGNQGEEG